MINFDTTLNSRGIPAKFQVTFSGEFEENTKTFLAKNFVINEYWSDTNPGVSFKPKPPEDDQIEPKPLKHKLPESTGHQI